jgi:hypothetical protein
VEVAPKWTRAAFVWAWKGRRCRYQEERVSGVAGEVATEVRRVTESFYDGERFPGAERCPLLLVPAIAGFLDPLYLQVVRAAGESRRKASRDRWDVEDKFDQGVVYGAHEDSV